MISKIHQDFKFHHIGLFVQDLEGAIMHYSQLFGKENISEVYNLASQNVKECFVKNGHNSYIGLVTPNNENSVVSNFIKKGIGYYHLAYKVKSIDLAIKHLEEINYKLVSRFNSEAFGGNLCVFLYTPDGHLVELIEE